MGGRSLFLRCSDERASEVFAVLVLTRTHVGSRVLSPRIDGGSGVGSVGSALCLDRRALCGREGGSRPGAPLLHCVETPEACLKQGFGRGPGVCLASHCPTPPFRDSEAQEAQPVTPIVGEGTSTVSWACVVREGAGLILT